MKPYFLLPLLFFFNFALSQEVYNAKTVDQFPIYPTCQDSINDLPNCFDKNLNEDVQKKLSEFTTKLNQWKKEYRDKQLNKLL